MEKLSDEKLREMLAASKLATPWAEDESCLRYEPDSNGPDSYHAGSPHSHECTTYMNGMGEPCSVARADAAHISNCSPDTIGPLLEELLEARQIARFYGTFSPRLHPEGYYEIHVAPGEGGEVRFGTRAREYLRKFVSGEV